jgi:putative nucleotidyltransferase with HDIG domain
MVSYALFALLTYASYRLVYFAPLGDRGHFREDAHLLLFILANLVGGAGMLAFVLGTYVVVYTLHRWPIRLNDWTLNLYLLTMQALTVYGLLRLLAPWLEGKQAVPLMMAMFATVFFTQGCTVVTTMVLYRLPLSVSGWKRNLLKFTLLDSLYVSLYVLLSSYIELTQRSRLEAVLSHALVVLAMIGLYYWRTVGIVRSQRVKEQLLELQVLNKRIAGANQQVLLAFASALEKRDPYTAGHSERVAQYAMAIARELGVGEADLRLIHLGGLLHDIGKIGIPDSVLHKQGRLTEEEYLVMKKHPVYGEEILRRVYTDSLIMPDQECEKILGIVLHHHERPDGRGYPHGLCGEEIPLFARITAVADAYDAMTSNRSYRLAMSPGKALMILREASGTQFWPPAVEAFERVLVSREEWTWGLEPAVASEDFTA